jgi:hypothetical protein
LELLTSPSVIPPKDYAAKVLPSIAELGEVYGISAPICMQIIRPVLQASLLVCRQIFALTFTITHFVSHIIVCFNAIPDLEKLLQGPDVPSRIIDAAIKVAKGEPSASAVTLIEESVKTEDQDTETVSFNPADMPKGPFLEDNVNSGIYPYNAYCHPFSHLKCSSEMDPALFATRRQRLIIPTIMPAGLDSQQILNERDRYIDARIQQ